MGLMMPGLSRRHLLFIAAAVVAGMLAIYSLSRANPSGDTNKRRTEMTEAKQPQYRTAGTDSRQLIFALRHVVNTVAWGKGPGQIPLLRSDMGGPQDVQFTGVLAVAPQTFWVHNEHHGSVFLVDLMSKTTSRVALEEASRGGRVGASGMAKAGSDQVAVLVGSRAPGEKARTFKVVLYDIRANRKGVIPLPLVSGATNPPERMAVTPGGTIWISGTTSTRLFDSKGDCRATIPAGGMMLPNGSFLTNGSAPMLYSEKGEFVGPVKTGKRSQPFRFLAAGPNGEVLAAGDSQSLPESLQGRIGLVDVLWFTEANRELTLEDRITVPPMTLEVPPSGEFRDGLPVRSYFPPGGVTFDAAGNIVMLEMTFTGCKFHMLRRIQNSDEWRQKFAHPEDLSSDELSIARAEYLTRLGLQAEAGPLARIFDGMVWKAQVKKSPDPAAGTASDPVLSALDPRKATRR